MRFIYLIKLCGLMLNIIDLHSLDILQFNLYNLQNIRRFLRIPKFIQVEYYSNIKITMLILHKL